MTPRKLIVLIMGYAQAGKDTAAQGLVRELGFKRYALADPLKEMALDINPCFPFGYLADLVGDVGWDRAKLNPLVREFLQRLGTEGIRKYVGADFWANFLLARTDDVPYVVVPDVRFANELWLLRSSPRRESVTFWIRRDGCEAGDHVSENSLNPQDADYILGNRGTENDLQAQIVSIVNDTFGIR